MNVLLLKSPLYINRLYVSLTGSTEVGIYLDFIMTKILKIQEHQIVINVQTIYNELFFNQNKIEKYNKKLGKLPFLSKQKQYDSSYIYRLDLVKHEIYLSEVA